MANNMISGLWYINLSSSTGTQKTQGQIRVPDCMASVTISDSTVDAFTAMRMLTKGLDNNSVNANEASQLKAFACLGAKRP